LVDVNFYSSSFGGAAATGAAAVGSTGDKWNGISAGASGGPVSLFDTTGASTSVTLSYDTSGGNSVTSVAQNTQPNPNLMNDYLFNNAGGNITVTLGNLLPNSTYDLYIYLASNDGGSSGARSALATANGTGATATGNPQSTFLAGQNYVLLATTSTSSGIINITESDLSPPNSTTEVDMNGLQIEGAFAPVPEPTTIIAGALLLLPFGTSVVRQLRK
jgi:hypothetical protein